MDKALKKDYNNCRQVMKKHSKTFSMAFSRLPSPKREAVWAFYAFNRNLDDIGDKTADRTKLEAEEQHFNDLLNGKVYPDPVYRALADVNRTFPIDREAVWAMFRGQYRDLDRQDIQTDDDLMAYCYEVAGSVGHMLLPILATKNQDVLRDSARKIGIAMQLTNILRDIREDFENSRVYLPQDKINAAGIDLENEIENGPSPAYIRLWEHYANLAIDLYNDGLADLPRYDPDSRFILVGAAGLYSAIIGASRRSGYGLTGRGHLSFFRKLCLLWHLKRKLSSGAKIQINGNGL